MEEIKKEIIRAINKGYFSGRNDETSKEIDKLAKNEAERIINLFLNTLK
jgi:hypothetical protein